MQELVKKINYLANKAKTEGLTEEEKEAQATLRREYIERFKSGLRQTLDNTYIVDEEGNKRKVEAKKDV